MKSVLVKALLLQGALGYTPCPILGPGYPEPVNLSGNSSALTSAWAKLTAGIESYLSANNSSQDLDFRGHSFSIGAFSVRDPSAQQKFQYHHSGKWPQNSTAGTNKVDGDSLYRVASLSKLITVYEVLIRLGSNYWDKPATDFIPQLAAIANSSRNGAVDSADWQGVTLGSLAGQISGITRDISFLITDPAIRFNQSGIDPTAEGLPALNASELASISGCNLFVGSPCNNTEFLSEVINMAPNYATWTTPAYADPPYFILALVLENIVKKKFGDLLQADMFSPLNMKSTSYNVPTNFSNAVIPFGDPAAVYYNTDVGPEKPIFGVYSSLNDLNNLAVSILNSTLLSSEETRKWLKPITHTANGNLSVGRPWEIYRLSQPETGRLNDLYTKDGLLGNYTSLLALSPDHDAGFNILVAGPQAPSVIPHFKDLLTETVFPAFESQAAAEAMENFAGDYTATDKNTNSSLSITVDPSSGPGMIVSSWINNGTDLMPTIESLYGIKKLDARLYPTNLVDNAGNGERKRAFKAVYGDSGAAPASGPFSVIDATCSSWGSVGALFYGGKALDQFNFEIGSDGRAVAVNVPAVRATLRKSG